MRKSLIMRCRRSLESKRAFTLVELLAAMAVLSVLVMLLAQIFNETSKGYLSAKRNVDINTEANAALKLMGRELSQAVFDRQTETNKYTVLRTERIPITPVSFEDAVHFMTSADAEKKLVSYTLVGNQLRRYIRNLPYNATNPSPNTAYYGNTNWPTAYAGNSMQPITTNVFSFRVDFCTDPQTDTYVDNANTHNQHLSYLNLSLEIVDSETMKIVSNLREANTSEALARADEIAAANSKRYTKRIYFNNYDGYYKNER